MPVEVIDLKRLGKMQEQLRKLEQEHARAHGRKEELLKRLNSEFGVETLEEAKKLLDTRTKEWHNKEDELQQLTKEIECFLTDNGQSI